MRSFVNHNGITKEGKAVIATLEEQVQKAGKDPAKLNNLPGYVQHYAANVTLMGTLTQEQWLRDYPSQAALVLERIEESARAEEAAGKMVEKTVETTLDAKLEAFEQKLLADVRKLLAEAVGSDDQDQDGSDEKPADDKPKGGAKSKGGAKPKAEDKPADDPDEGGDAEADADADEGGDEGGE